MGFSDARLRANFEEERKDQRIAELEAVIQSIWKAYTVVTSAGNGAGAWDRHVKPEIFAAKKLADQ